MDIQLAVPETSVTAPVLDAALEAVTRLDEELIRNGKAPTIGAVLQQGGVRWQPEPPGAERFDHAATVVSRGWGDCDDLAPWHAASLRVTGEDPEAVAVVRKSGPNRWHAVVQRHDGSIDDPSRAAGMGRARGAPPAVTSPMFRATAGVNGVAEMKPAMACRPSALGGWEGRVDLPWSGTDYAMSVFARMPTAATALTGAVCGAQLLHQCSGFADEQDARSLVAVGALLDGHSPRDVASVVGRAMTRRALEVLAGVAPHLGDVPPVFAAVEVRRRGG